MYRISIWTQLYKDDELVKTWGDPITLHHCSERLRRWVELARHRTTKWINGFSPLPSEDCVYSLRYRVIVMDEGSKTTVSDSDYEEFWCLSRFQILRFQVRGVRQYAHMLCLWLWG